MKVIRGKADIELTQYEIEALEEALIVLTSVYDTYQNKLTKEERSDYSPFKDKARSAIESIQSFLVYMDALAETEPTGCQ